MNVICRAATVGLWCDASQKVSAEQAAGLKAVGYVGIVRYVPLPKNGARLDIDASELDWIVEAGLELMLVQHVRESPKGSRGWDPAAHSGTVDGQDAADFAKAAGYPAGAHLWLDLEDIGGSGLSTIAFAEAWAGAVMAAGFKAGAYVGFDVPLDAQALYDLHGFDSYWSDAGPRAVADRGFAMKQITPQVVVAGVEIDRDDLQADRHGEVPFVAAAAPAEVA
jgi:hypothetical protein